MAPKKKSRQSTRSIQDEESITLETPEPILEPPPLPPPPLFDGWTDEQETSLFKAVMKWKPAGMHKHFRMLSIAGYLRNHGYDPAIETHTQIPGIWKKLRTYFNLEAIDEREDFDYPDDEDLSKHYKEFSLPLDEYGVEMMERGRDTNWRGSPPCQDRPVEDFQLPPTKKRKRESTITGSKVRGSSRIRDSTVEDTDEPKTSPPPPSGRRGRSARRKGGSSVREASRGTTVETESTRNEEDQEEDGEEEVEDSEQEAPTSKGARSSTQKGPKASMQTTRKSKRKK